MEKKTCPVYKKCGGCQLLHLSYQDQLAKKQKEMSKLLSSFGKVEKIIGMENPYYYRNKIHSAFAIDRKGKIVNGIYEENSHKVVPVSECLLENQAGSTIVSTVGELIKSFKMKVYNEDSGYGLIRHVMVRTGYHSGEVMVVIITASPVFPSKRNFVNALLKKHPEITTVIHNVNERHTSMVLGKTNHVLYGKGYITDTLCGMKFRISPNSFYQVNPVQTEVLYGKVMEFAKFSGKETVLDAYAGTGTIGMIASQYVGRVISVELNGEAVRDAIANAKENQIRNISFYKQDAGVFMTMLAQKGEKVDVVITDPPRSGCSMEFLNSLFQLAPKKVVYVSCGPDTLARDLEVFKKNGYKVKVIQPIDMFCHTNHVETVVLLSHKSPDSHISVTVEFGEGEGKVPLDKIAERAKQHRPAPRVTYKMIQEYIEKKYGFKVHTAYIAELKRELGLSMYDVPNAVEGLKQPRKHLTAEQIEAIKDAFKFYTYTGRKVNGFI